MTHPVIIERTAYYERLHAELGSPKYDVNARATAVADLFVSKILGGADDVPLEQLVTPTQLPACQAEFENPTRMAAPRERLQHVGVVAPRVHPQPDGSTHVLFVHTHPEAKEPVLLAPQEVEAIPVVLRLVDNPDDWRVSRVG